MSLVAPVRPSADAAAEAARAFGLDIHDAPAPVAGGHINESFRVDAEQGSWLLQWLNPRVFPDLWGTQRNVELVLAHLQANDPAAGWPRLRRQDARSLLQLPSGHWRALEWLPHRCMLQHPDSAALAATGAAGFARFVTSLRELPARQLSITLPGFHDLAGRLGELNAAVEAASAAAAAAPRLRHTDPLQRALGDLAHGLIRDLPDGPACVIHGDTKFANLLFAEQGDSALPVDYDTVMAGPLAWDLGDMLRSIASPAGEEGSEQVELDEQALQAAAAGYARGIAGWVGAEARAAMALAPAYLACVLAVRFLTDYLHGDVYFRVRHPDHNLQRAARQLALARALVPFAGALRRVLQAPI